MSYEIDNRAVHMEFDNAQFEKNVKTTMSTLDKFKEKLNLSGAAKGLDEVDKAANRVNIKPLGNALEQVSAKFSALEIIGITALANITNSAVNAGKRLVKSLSIDQISAGWQKFGSKTTSVGTLIAQGYDISTVTDQLDKLNWFTDETSYNFVDMVSNIAKFTASGQDLESSVTALEGIANWAALSGQNATTASRAMYQISQAMGAGIMRKEDYKSIQNVSMDTDEFRQKALDAGVALGKLKKNADGTYESLVSNKGAFTKSQFAEHLTQDAWMTSDVMMQVFNDYSAAVKQIYEYADEHCITASEAIEELGDKVDEFGLKAFKAAQEARTWGDVVDSVKDAVSTGWMKTFELIIGNYEQSKRFYTDLANSMYDIFAEPINARNQVLKDALSSGWEKLLFAGIKNEADYIDEIKTVAKETSDAFETILENNPDDFISALRQGLSEGAISADTLSTAVDNLFVKMKASEVGAEAISLDDFMKKSKEEIIEFQKEVGILADGVIGPQTLGALEAYNKKLSESISDYSEAEREAIRELKEQLDDGTLSMQDFVDEIGKISGRENLVKSFWNVWDALGRVLGSVKEAFQDVFPAAQAEQVFNFTEKLKNFTEKLILSEEQTEKLKNTFSGLFNFIGIGVDIIKEIGTTLLDIFRPLLSALFPSVDGVLDFTSSIADAIKKCRKWVRQNNNVRNVLYKIRDAVVAVYTNISDAFSWFFNLESVQTVLTKIKDIFSSLGEELSGAFADGVEKVKDFFETIRTAKPKSIGELIQAIKNFGSTATTELDLVSAKFSDTGTKFGDLFSSFNKTAGEGAGDAEDKVGGIGDIFETFKSKVSDVSTFLESKVNSEDLLPAIIGLGSAGALYKTVKTASTMFTSFTDVVAGFSKLGPAVTKVVTSYSKILAAKAKSEKWTALSEVFKDIGVAVLVVAAAMYVLSKIDETKLDGAIRALRNVAGVLALFAVAIGVIGKFLGVGGVISGFSIVGLAIGVILLVKSLETLSEIDFAGKDPSSMILGLITIMVSLMLVAGLLGKYVPDMSKGAFTIIAIGLAVKILVSALKDLAEINTDGLNKNLPALIVAILALIIITALSKAVNWQSGIGMLAIVLTLKLFVALLEDLGNIEWTFKKVLDLIAVVVLVAILSTAMGKLPGMDLKASGSLLAMALSIAILVGCLKIMESISFGNLLKSVIALSIIIKVFSKSLKSLENVKSEAKASIFALAVVVGVLALSLAMLSAIPFGRLLGAVIALGVVLALLPKVLTEAGKMGADSFKPLIAMVAMIIVIAAALMLLSANAVGAIGAAVAMGLLILAIAYSIQLMDYVKIDASVLYTLGIMTVVIMVMAVILDALSELDPLQAIGTAVAIGVMVLALAASLKLMDNVKTPGLKALGAIVVMTIIMGLFGGLLWLLQGMDPLSTLATAVGIGILVAALSLSLAWLVPVGAFAGVALNGIGILLLLIVAITVVFVSLGYLTTVVDPEIISKGIELLEAIFLGLGTAFGNLIGGAIQGFLGALPSLSELGAELSAFSESMEPFFASASKIDIGAITSIAALIEALAAITFANVLGSIAEKITGAKSMTEFAQELIPLGVSISKFAHRTKQVDGAKIESIAGAIEKIASIGDILQGHEGVKQWLLGDKSFANFGTELSSLGAGLKTFNTDIANIDTEKISSATTSVKALIEAANSLGNSGGTVTWFTGDNTLAGFATDIKTFLETMGESKFGNLSQTNAKLFSTCVTTLSGAASTLENHGVLKGLIVGDNKLSTFAEDIQEFLTIMSGTTSEAGEAVGEDISQTNLFTKLGTFITDFTTSLASFDTEEATAAAGSLDTLRAAVATFIETVGEALSGHSEPLAAAGEGIMNSVKIGIETGIETIKTTVAGMAESAVTAINDYYQKFYDAGVYAGQGIVSGLRSQSGPVYNAAYYLGWWILQGLTDKLNEQSPSKETYHIAEYAGQGLVNGLDSYGNKVYSASSNLGGAMLDGFNSAIQTLSSSIENGIDSNPTITPILDLSNVEKGASKLSTMFNGGTVRASTQAGSIAASRNATDIVVTPKPAASVVNNNFTQNNYSPKALSRADIYRQTKSQFSAMERMANA